MPKAEVKSDRKTRKMMVYGKKGTNKNITPSPARAKQVVRPKKTQLTPIIAFVLEVCQRK